jgi:hypothetical protein
MVSIVVAVTIYLSYVGYSYYELPVEERFYHPQYDWFKPSGDYGHGLGILGTLMILFGVVIYIARKKYGFLERFIRIKYLLEFHIFLCSLGPILVLFHTSFKFGGIVSIAFWSMVAVVISGVIGRFIYIQIPRNIQGKELGKEQLLKIRDEMIVELQEKGNFNEDEIKTLFGEETESRDRSRFAKKMLKAKSVSKSQEKNVLKVLKDERRMEKRIRNLNQMQKLFKYWHVAHQPFALIMLVIVIVHVGVTLAFGYKWIF